MTALTMFKPVAPTEVEAKLAQESSRRLARYRRGDLKVRVPGSDESIILPAAAVRLLIDLLSEMAAGNAITLIPIHAELTTQQAADLLGVSRPFLIKQMQAGHIPFRKVGSHRRIMFTDLMGYKDQMQAGRLKALDELAEQGQRLDMGY